MEATFVIDKGVGVVTVTGPLTAAGVDSFREQFGGWWQNASELRNVVMDLGGVEFLDSAGLGALIALLKRVTERGGDLKIARLQKKARMVFEITRAYEVFDILDSVEEAVKACG